MVRLIVCAVLAAAMAAGQNQAPAEPGSISGVVINAETAQPAPEVEVFASGPGDRVSAITDAQGRYTIEGVQAGRRTVYLGGITS